ncbi:MAG TPA: glycosyltransferase [Burkholderiaceae bacterium]|nr:glycosyltransferase [Burkholderiaceae bacterium]
MGCVLRAFALVQRRWPDARLTVAGDGSERFALEQLASQLDLQHVHFVGRVEHGRMPELYDAADVYLNAPNIDNMPGSIIESFAAGLPVVTTDAGGIPYIVTDGATGRILPRGDHAALAAAAIGLLEDEELVDRLTKAARAECHKYIWGAVRAEWVQLYREMALSPKASSNSRASLGEGEKAALRLGFAVCYLAPLVDLVGML